ncbi:hypothetical protein [Burkholderia phage FLC9]|nr:hypothetical protein [Burkholderia phage FLC9]
MFFGLFGSKEKTITPDQIEILIHKEAAYFGEHGRMLATNKELGVVEKEVIFCAKGFTSCPPLNHRMYAHIWNSFLAEGWIPLEMTKYGSVIEKQVQGNDDVQDPQPGRRQVKLALADNLSQAEAVATVEGAAAAISSARSGDFSALEVPTFLRKEAQEGTGFKSAGFDAATAAS